MLPAPVAKEHRKKVGYVCNKVGRTDDFHSFPEEEEEEKDKEKDKKSPSEKLGS